jgi:hypothetical protein
MPNVARRTIAVGSLVAVLTSGLAACGSKHSSSGSAPAPTPTASAQQSMGTGDPYADIRTAAQHMPDIAATLAAGIAKADSPTASPAPTPKSAAIAGDPDSAAAGLRAKLSYLLTEHTYLAGLAVATMYHFGPDAEATTKASNALDANANDVATLIGTVAPNDKDTFLQSWRQHDTDFVTYAKAAKAGTAAASAKTAAQRSLAGYARSAGEFFNKISNDHLSSTLVAQSFTVHISSLTAAIDGLAAGSTDAFKLLKTAAGHMDDSAAYLASGIAKSANLPGETASKASVLRSTLTGLLTSHVYLAGVAVFTAYSTSGATDSPAFQAAGDALDTNSQDLATQIGQVAGSANQSKFLQTWRKHIDDFVSYAKADAAKDSSGKSAALADLDAYRSAAGQFFSDITGGAIQASAVADALKDHVQSLAGAIDSLRTAVLDVPVTTPPSFGPVTSSAEPSESASPTPTATKKSTKKTATPTPLAPTPTATASPSATAAEIPEPR